MKRLLVLTILGVLLVGATGCKFWDCLWRGPQYQNCPPQTVSCPTYVPCDPSPCCGAPTTTVSPTPTPAAPTTPGPETYAPAGR